MTFTRSTLRTSFAAHRAFLIPVAVIGLLVLPMTFTHRSFGSDWTLHLWLVRQQQWNIDAIGHPGLFVSARPLGAFYPIFAFVGSGVYSVGAYLAIALGDRPIVAYKLLYVIGMCLAYGGMTWLSFQRGLRGWRAQMAGLVTLTGTYFISDLAVRGDLGEYLALTSIPFLLAATYAVLTSPRLRVRHLLAVAAGMFVFTGSHNITLLWGSVFFVMIALVVLVAYAPRLRRHLPWRRVGALVGCALIGVGLNAWYLFPDLAYGLDTVIAGRNRGKLPTVVPHFDPLFGMARPGSPIRVTVPLLFVAWAIIAELLLWRERDGASKRLFFGVLTLTGAYAALISFRAPWQALPDAFYNIQFTRRLDAYAVLTTALLVIVALEWHGVERLWSKRFAAATLVLVALATVGLANWQLWRGRSFIHIPGRPDVATGQHFDDLVVSSRTVIPPSWYARDEFRDVTSRYVKTSGKRALNIPLAAVHGDRFSGLLRVPSGGRPFRTNISAGPRFVRMTGIEAVGRTTRGFVVAERSPGAPRKGPIRVTIGRIDTGVVRSGARVTVASGLAFVALLAWPALRRLGRVTRRRSAPAT